MIKRKPAISSLLSSIGRKPTPTRIPPSPSKYAASVHQKKYNIGTPRTKNFITNASVDKKRSTPKSLKALLTSSNVRESCKLTSPSVQKTQSKKPFPSIRTTPMKTPSKVKFVIEIIIMSFIHLCNVSLSLVYVAGIHKWGI